ncbi:MAG: PIN domain-containing protein [Roseovarius sp.]|nr:PIN domain-containing protein [Roseovarius sp.]MDM8164468.1 PIN domain-containing protein [Roseovarius sp.]
MIPAANRYTVTLDASVLFPNMKRDVLLRFFEADLYRAQWTERIQQEWLTNAIRTFPDKEDRLLRTDSLMRTHFDSAWVEETEYAHLIDLVTLPDADDRHVVAAAIAGRSDYIVTDNLKHFPEAELSRFRLEVGSADKFLSGTLEHYPQIALTVLAEHRQGLRSAPSPVEYIMLLRQRGLPRLAAHVHAHIGLI